MTPNSSVDPKIPDEKQKVETAEHKIEIIWYRVIAYVTIHVLALYGLYLAFTSASWKLIFFTLFYNALGNLGVTAGAHRLWSHNSYKAKLPMRILLCIFASIPAQFDIYDWSNYHRLHHKYADTNGDPHNINRGFFFSHVGWLLCRLHPEVIANFKKVPMDDLWRDPVVRFHRRYYVPMVLLFCYILPIAIPVWWWGEPTLNAFFVACIVRVCISMHITFLVNSVAHSYGNRPFDRHMEARESLFLSLLTYGEGYHNFHHAFPWDYASNELVYTLNLTKWFIDAMAAIGWAYDLKTTTPETIARRKLKTGDGSRPGVYRRVKIDR